MCRAKDQWEACSHISQNHVTPYYKVENECDCNKCVMYTVMTYKVQNIHILPVFVMTYIIVLAN